MAKERAFALIKKCAWLLRHRPTSLWPTVRGYVLFQLTYFLRRLVKLEGIRFESNVRLQRLRSVMAEVPSAQIYIGEGCIVYEDARLEAYGNGNIHIGAGSIIGGARIVSRFRVQIGERFLASWNIFIQDFDSHPSLPELRRAQVEKMVADFKPSFHAGERVEKEFNWSFPGEEIVIGDDVWLGAGVTVLKGARIGTGSIVATGSVVRKGTYPPCSLLAGAPAKVVKNLQQNIQTVLREDDRNHRLKLLG